MINVAIIGAGVIGRRFSAVFQQNKDVHIIGYFDINTKASEELSQEYGGKVYHSFEQVLDDESVDLIYIGVPPKFHKEYAVEGLNSSKHILCEKPMAVNFSECKEMIDRAAQSSTQVAINFPFRYSPGFKELKRLLASKALGEILRVNLTFRFPQWPRTWQNVDWLRFSEQGGAMREVGSHYLFALGELEEYIGTPEEIISVTNRGQELAESSLLGIIKLDSGIQVKVDLLTGGLEEEENTLEVICEQGSFRFERWYQLFQVQDGQKTSLNAERVSTETMTVHAFLEKIETGKSSSVTFEEGAKTQKLLDALYSNTTVQL